jgi:hypothetical protein
MGNEKAKRKWLMKWINTGQVIVAINALGMGLDVPNILGILTWVLWRNLATTCRKADVLEGMAKQRSLLF